MVQYAVSLLGMQRNNVEGRRDVEHIHSNRGRYVQSPTMVDVQGVFSMIEVLECPLCSARIRRQGMPTRLFIDRFVVHINHYHGKYSRKDD